MKIGLVLGRQLPCYGGGFTYQEEMIKTLLSYQGQHEFYFFYEGEPPSFAQGNNHFISTSHYVNPLDEIPVLSALLLKYKIDLCWFLTCQVTCVHTPYICTVWDLEHRKHPFFPEVSQTGWSWEAREANCRQLLPKAAYLICGTEQGKNELQYYYQVPAERIKIMPFPIPSWLVEYENKLFPEPLLQINGRFLLYPAQFWPHKNHIVLLHALKILTDQYGDDFTLVFTGSDMGNLQHVQEEVKRLKLENKVIFYSFVPREMLAYLYKHAFALVYPSFFGPDNIPPLEAFGLQCPVLAATTFASHQHLTDAVMLFDPTKEAEIAEKIHALSSDQHLRETLIAHGLAFYKQQSKNTWMQEIHAILDEFILYRRTWSSNTLYHHFNPEPQESANNMQCSIDDIYALLMKYKAENQALSQEIKLLQKKLNFFYYLSGIFVIKIIRDKLKTLRNKRVSI